jgi:hypothetical protein
MEKDFATGVYLSEALNHIRLPPPLTHCIRAYSILINTEKGGRGRVERLEGQQFTRLGRTYQHDLLYLKSINSDIHLPQSPFPGPLF